MSANIPDYYVALIKQKANLMNDQQAVRVSQAISQVISTSTTPAQSNAFFALAPTYLRPHRQSFFASVGNWQRPVSAKPAIEQLSARLQLTDAEEAKVLLRAYFGAIRTLVARDIDSKISLGLPKELAALYLQSRRG